MPEKSRDFFDFWSLFVPSNISFLHEIQGNKKIEIMSKEFHFTNYRFEKKLTIEAFISNTGHLSMTSNFGNTLMIGVSC